MHALLAERLLNAPKHHGLMVLNDRVIQVYTLAVEGDCELHQGYGDTQVQNDTVVKKAAQRMRKLMDGWAIRIKVQLPE